MEIKPNSKETQFLTIACNRFYDLYDEYRIGVNTPERKFEIIKNIFSIYSECLKYEPIKHYIQYLEKIDQNETLNHWNFSELYAIYLHIFPFIGIGMKCVSQEI